MLQLWRTLLLSCFTASRPTTPSRFTTFRGATLFPYIKYVASLDARTLVLVLTEIMKSQRVTGTTALDPGAAEFFFSGALGAFEISGEARGERMVVGGPEYAVQCPVGGKEVKIFVGDTALMIMDCTYVWAWCYIAPDPSSSSSSSTTPTSLRHTAFFLMRTTVCSSVPTHPPCQGVYDPRARPAARARAHHHVAPRRASDIAHEPHQPRHLVGVDGIRGAGQGNCTDPAVAVRDGAVAEARGSTGLQPDDRGLAVQDAL